MHLILEYLMCNALFNIFIFLIHVYTTYLECFFLVFILWWEYSSFFKLIVNWFVERISAVHSKLITHTPI